MSNNRNFLKRVRVTIRRTRFDSNGRPYRQEKTVSVYGATRHDRSAETQRKQLLYGRGLL